MSRLHDLIYRRYRGALVRFFERRTVTGAEAEDLAQDVYLRLAAQTAGADRPVENPQAYLFAIATNLVRDRARAVSVRRRVLYEPGPDESFDAVDTLCPERTASARQLLDRAKAAIGGLDPDVRAVFLLNRYEGFSYREIAGSLGIGIPEIRRRMRIATAALVDAAGPEAGRETAPARISAHEPAPGRLSKREG